MNYQQTLNYLYSALPMFHRIGAAAYKPDLNNTIALCNVLDNPQNTVKCIHIAGTNGKGSVSNMLASILQEADYRTGLYTSPHLKDFRERIRINGKKISRQYVCSFVEQYKADFEKIKPSFFEMTVGLAFNYFRDKKVDIAIIETGLGGRLDSTNVITPILSIITNIGYDHMNLLGNTLPEIAAEKAGIIKKNIPVVIGESKPELNELFKKAAKKNNAPIYFANRNYKAEISTKEKKANSQYLKVNVFRKEERIFNNLKLDLIANYQLKNCITVMQSIEILQNKLNVKNSQIKRGLSKVSLNTGFAGRWQILSRRPLMIADTGHNVDGVVEVMKMLVKYKYNTLHFVLGMVNDKEIDTILKLLPRKAIYYFCKADIPRGLDANVLQGKAGLYNLTGKNYSSVKNAVRAAIKNAHTDDMIFIGGSTFTVAEAI
jgi:dihydrofolate synthase / folylpolyglutamate synthase